MSVASSRRQPAVDLREAGGWRRSKNRIATVLMWIAFVVTVIPLGLAIVTVVAKGISAISWQFLTSSDIPPNTSPLGFGGMGPAVIGTLEITRFAPLIAPPPPLLGAISLNQSPAHRSPPRPLP